MKITRPSFTHEGGVWGRDYFKAIYVTLLWLGMGKTQVSPDVTYSLFTLRSPLDVDQKLLRIKMYVIEMYR